MAIFPPTPFTPNRDAEAVTKANASVASAPTAATAPGFVGIEKDVNELLIMLAEEATEVAHAATKILRHGFESYNPDELGGGTNRARLHRELTDLAAVHGLLRAKGVLRDTTETDVVRAVERKMRYRHHAR